VAAPLAVDGLNGNNMTKTKIIQRELPAEIKLPDDMHPVLRRVYAARKVGNVDEIDYSLSGLHSYTALGGIDRAVELLAAGIESGQRILVCGDFDADGATSCAVAVRGLRLLGAADAGFLVPNRFEYGYGLTPEIVEVAMERSPDILVTVDNGISSIDGVRAARDHGLKVIVTDHHLPGRELPAADAIVNPNLDDDPFPSKYLAGVGVMFYVLAALRAALREKGWFDRRGIGEPNMGQLLDLVALGTVADVVPLDRNNRILVAQGLARIRAGRGKPGINALCRVAGRDPARLTAADLAFAVAPRLNAAGRIDDMSHGVDCLLCDDEHTAMGYARQLHDLNGQRRDIEQEMREQAMASVDEMQLEEDSLPVGLCLFDERWHQGVIGILAARIRERVHRPVIAFAADGADRLKGSARSVPGLHIRDAIDAVATSRPGLVGGFGGHAMAAGLTLQRDKFADFSAAFDEQVRGILDEGQLHGVVLSDGQLQSHELGLDLAEQLREAGPWGQAFPEPVFDGEFEVTQRRVVGGSHLKLQLRIPDTRQEIDAIAFNTTDEGWPEQARVQLAYRLDVNEWRGNRQAQLVVEHIELETDLA